jgi:RND family efflux transporter MFP subunit
MKKRMRSALTIAACAALAVFAGACGKKGGPSQAPPVSVVIGQAVKMDTPIIITAFGNTEDRVSIDIIPQVSGILQKIFIKDGEIVKTGQQLFLIDQSDYKARVKQAEGLVKADRANLELARITLERNKPLLDKNLISKENFDTIKTKVQAIEAQLQMDEGALEAAKLSLTRCTIKAPVDGVCSKRYMDEGNLVSAGMSRLTNIRSYDPIRVAFSVSEQYLPAIRSGMEAGKVKIEITPRGETNSYTGTLEFMDNAVNPATGTILLRGEVPNPNLKLWANQFVDVSIHVSVVPGAVMVPEGAVQFGKNGPYLFAVKMENRKDKDGKETKVPVADMRLVKTGVRYNNLIQVLGGVDAGEPIVVLGQFMLYPGAVVMDLSKMPKGPAAGPGGAMAGKQGDKGAKQEGAKSGQEKNH